MSRNIAIKAPIYFHPDSEDVCNGKQMALDTWVSTSEGKSHTQAAADLTESLMGAIISMNSEQAAAEIYGAALFLLEISPTPKVKEPA